MPGEGIALSRDLLLDLYGEIWARVAIEELFVLHGRRPFRPRLEDLGGAIWGERGARQQFARAISLLHVKGYIRWLPDGRYRIVSRRLLTAAEFEESHPEDGPCSL
jgi:hypothetical protein